LSEDAFFTYDSSGRLIGIKKKFGKGQVEENWSLSRNGVGDINLVDFGVGQTRLSHGAGGRVNKIPKKSFLCV